MSHLIISCIDGRIRDRVRELEEKIGEKNSLWILVPGGPLAFSEPNTEIESLLSWIDTLITRQGVHKIVLASHQQCLAYGRKLGGFFHDEREILARDLAKAKKALLEKFFGIRVECYIVPWLDRESPGIFGPAEMIDIPA